MKKFLLAFAIISFFTATAGADTFSISAFYGFTSVDALTILGSYSSPLMGAMNNPIYKIINSQQGTAFSNDFGGGSIAGVDIGYVILPGLSICIRPELILPSDAVVDYSDDKGDEVKFDFNTSLIPLMAGVSYIWTSDVVPVSLGAGAYGGYAIANGSVSDNQQMPNLGGTSFNTSDAISGGWFVGELEANARYQFSAMFSLGIKIGYRFADIGEMTYNSANPYIVDYNGNHVTKGEALPSINGGSQDFDFSGTTIAGCLNVTF